MNTITATPASEALESLSSPLTVDGPLRLTEDDLRTVKRAFSTRRVDLAQAAVVRRDLAPSNGDLVLATVGELGQHKRIELPEGRRAPLREGDRIIVAYANRYAPDQFEAFVPADLGPVSLVAGGGVAGRVSEQHARMLDATELLPIGLVADADGRVLNVADAALPAVEASPRPPVVAVIGAAMNAGKTTTVAKLVQGLVSAGERVGAIKVTGTGSGGDMWSFHDHGAHAVYDFTDFGWATTADIGVNAVAGILRDGIARLTADGCTAIVVEVADGVFQRETGALVEHPVFDALVDSVLFAATDALCGMAGVDWLTQRGHAPVAVSGVITASPLATREMQAQSSTPIWGIDTLSDPVHAKGVLAAARARQSR